MNATGWASLAAWVVIVPTAVAAYVGVRQAKQANARAGEANQLAAEANDHAAEALILARSAEERADRMETLSLERRDVQWERHEVDDGETVSFENVGTDTACDVRLVVDPIKDYRRQESEQPSVGPGDRIAVRLSAIAREEKAAWEAAGREGIFLTPGFDVRARITWESPSGVPDTFSWDELTV